MEIRGLIFHPYVTLCKYTYLNPEFFENEVIVEVKRSQGGYSGFQVTRMIEGFFWFEIFDSGIFLGRKIWQVFFGWLDV